MLSDNSIGFFQNFEFIFQERVHDLASGSAIPDGFNHFVTRKMLRNDHNIIEDGTSILDLLIIISSRNVICRSSNLT
jgi:hypothetical protein